MGRNAEEIHEQHGADIDDDEILIVVVICAYDLSVGRTTVMSLIPRRNKRARER